jgi:hypothetical protein
MNDSAASHYIPRLRTPAESGTQIRTGRAPAGHGAIKLVAVVLLVALAMISANPLLTVGSVVVGVLVVRLLWRPGEPAILLFMVGFQWLQVATRIFEADVLGIPVAELTADGLTSLDETIWLSLLALLALALGLRLGAGPKRHASSDEIRLEVAELSAVRVLVAYLVLAVLGQLFEAVAWEYLPLTQILLALASLKTIPFVILACMVLIDGRGHRFLATALLIETVLGLSGYFADFKPVFYILIMIAMAARLRLTFRRMAIAGMVGVTLVVLSLFWTVVKSDYRAFINRGTNTQTVQVSRQDRFQFMRNAIGRATISDIVGAIQPAVARLGAVDLFAATVYYVPRITPHTNGQIWFGAIRHTLMPRLLFPNKPVLTNDSRSTRRFTGLAVAGENEGTSIGIGYVAESYVDFGRLGMWFPIFCLGFIWGWMYRALLRRRSHRVMAYGLAIICLLPVMFFETAATKQLGSGLSRLIVLSVVLALYERRWWNAMRPRRRAVDAAPVPST